MVFFGAKVVVSINWEVKVTECGSFVIVDSFQSYTNTKQQLQLHVFNWLSAFYNLYTIIYLFQTIFQFTQRLDATNSLISFHRKRKEKSRKENLHASQNYRINLICFSATS